MRSLRPSIRNTASNGVRTQTRIQLRWRDELISRVPRHAASIVLARPARHPLVEGARHCRRTDAVASLCRQRARPTLRHGVGGKLPRMCLAHHRSRALLGFGQQREARQWLGAEQLNASCRVRHHERHSPELGLRAHLCRPGHRCRAVLGGGRQRSPRQWKHGQQCPARIRERNLRRRLGGGRQQSHVCGSGGWHGALLGRRVCRAIGQRRKLR